MGVNIERTDRGGQAFSYVMKQWRSKMAAIDLLNAD
jgi:hypothetical protein